MAFSASEGMKIGQCHFLCGLLSSVLVEMSHALYGVYIVKNGVHLTIYGVCHDLYGAVF